MPMNPEDLQKERDNLLKNLAEKSELSLASVFVYCYMITCARHLRHLDEESMAAVVTDVALLQSLISMIADKSQNEPADMAVMTRHAANVLAKMAQLYEQQADGSNRGQN